MRVGYFYAFFLYFYDFCVYMKPQRWIHERPELRSHEGGRNASLFH